MTDKEIFEICSPCSKWHELLKGPYYIVHKHPSDEFAIVAIDYRVSTSFDYVPCLGIRWMEGNGMPCRGSAKMWFVLPGDMKDAILSYNRINKAKIPDVDDFLTGKISGKELMNRYFNNHLNDNSVFLQGGFICDAVTKQPIQRNRYNP